MPDTASAVDDFALTIGQDLEHPSSLHHAQDVAPRNPSIQNPAAVESKPKAAHEGADDEAALDEQPQNWPAP